MITKEQALILSDTHWLAYMRQPYYDMVVNLEKTIESRFSIHRTVIQKVTTGDVIWWKESGNPAIPKYMSTVDKVEHYQNLTPERINELRYKYNFSGILAESSFWKDKERSRYGSIIFFTTPIEEYCPLPLPTHCVLGWANITPKNN